MKAHSRVGAFRSWGHSMIGNLPNFVSRRWEEQNSAGVVIGEEAVVTNVG